MPSPTSCPKCEGDMQEGFTLRPPSRLISRWVSGKPVFSFWSGFKLSGQDQHPVQTLRCAKCGYLESYANGTC